MSQYTCCPLVSLYKYCIINCNKLISNVSTCDICSYYFKNISNILNALNFILSYIIK